jgi:hypothetical protein
MVDEAFYSILSGDDFCSQITICNLEINRGSILFLEAIIYNSPSKT